MPNELKAGMIYAEGARFSEDTIEEGDVYLVETCNEYTDFSKETNRKRYCEDNAPKKPFLTRIYECLPGIDHTGSFFVGAWFGVTAAASVLHPESAIYLAMLYPAAFLFNAILMVKRHVY